MKCPVIKTLLLLLLCAPALGWSDTSDPYPQAIAAFKAGDFEEARDLFTEAYAAGRSGPRLLFNLGVVHFKLGEYDKARASFELLVSDAQWGTLAEYNLGLIADASGDAEAAQRHYRTVYQRADSPKLRGLASSRINGMSVTAADEGRWYGSFATGAGYDDNVVLANDDALQAISDEDDYFAEVSGATGGFISGDYQNGWAVDLDGYYRFYQDLNDFDFGSAGAGTNYNRMVGKWHLQAGGRVGGQFAGGEHFTSNGTARFRAYRGFDTFGVRISNDAEYVDGASDYDYLTGWRNRLTTELLRTSADTRLRLGYQLELNDRDDLVTADEFFNYSPTRHQLFAEGTFNLSDRFTVLTRAAFRKSDYDDDNVMDDGQGNAVIGKRDDNRISATLGLSYRVTKHWYAFGEYVYTDIDADLETFSYENNQMMVGIRSDF
jgi:hypothetical protein